MAGKDSLILRTLNPFILKIPPSPHSVQARLPEVYKKYLAELGKEPSPVHYIPEPGKWKICSYTGRITKIDNVPLPLKYPKEVDYGIWGGEGVIIGLIEKKVKRGMKQYVTGWFPTLKREIVYSEILNKYMFMTVTERALRLIDKHCGFDNYILETPVQDLKSQLALDLRHKMMLTLVNREKVYEDDVQQELIWKKYQKFEIPKEEAEWVCLSLKEAVRKQKLLEEEAEKPPLKHYYRKNLIEELKAKKLAGTSEEEDAESGVSTYLSKVPFIGSKIK